MVKPAKNISEYINSFPKSTRAILQKMRLAIKSAAPEAKETIKYRMPTFVLNGKNLVHFAAMKNHIGFYPTPKPIKVFRKELSKYKTSKGAIQFPVYKPIPLGLVKKITKFRVNNLLLNITNY